MMLHVLRRIAAQAPVPSKLNCPASVPTRPPTVTAVRVVLTLYDAAAHATARYPSGNAQATVVGVVQAVVAQAAQIVAVAVRSSAPKFKPVSDTVEPPVVTPFCSVWYVGTGASNVNAAAAADEVPTIAATVTAMFIEVGIAACVGDWVQNSAVTDVQDVDAHPRALESPVPCALTTPTSVAVAVASRP